MLKIEKIKEKIKNFDTEKCGEDLNCYLSRIAANQNYSVDCYRESDLDCSECLRLSLLELLEEYKEPWNIDNILANCEVIEDEEISKLLTPQKPKTVWDLKDGDKCFKVHCNGAIEARNWNKNDDNLNKCRELGFIFLTKEEAEFEVERRKCEVIMLKHGTRDTVPENLEHVYKWTIGIDNKNKATHSNFIWRVVSSGTIWFATKELVHKTIEEIGEDRLKKYVLKV